jgi:uncharacterized protein (DUF427 family)
LFASVSEQTDQRGRVRVEPCTKRIRAVLGGEVVVDTTDALYVWEVPYYPQYYVPVRDVADGALVPTETVTHSPSRGDARHFTVKTHATEAVDAAWQYTGSPIEQLRECVRFDWNSMDAWFEEDEEVFVHPRSPYARVDILPSSRHVRIELDGVTVAESAHPTFLFETGLPRRTYVPKVDVRMDLLVPTDTSSMCPYKGTARYWTVRSASGEETDVAWSYPTPLRESLPIAGLVAFYDERVDVYVDGVRQERPRTPFVTSR